MVSMKFENLLEVWKRIKRNNHFTFGAPFFLFVAGCFYYLNHTQSIKYVFSQQTKHRLYDLESFGFRNPGSYNSKSLEEIYDEIKDKDTKNWENKRIPRPWEE